MNQGFQIEITDERRTQRHRVLELTVHSDISDDPFLAIASLHGYELYLNLPANPEANSFISWLSERIGEPSEAPTVKCSANWSEHMIGPMQTVTWKLPPEAIKEFDRILA
jgi:hypothetical protein